MRDSFPFVQKRCPSTPLAAAEFVAFVTKWLLKTLAPVLMLAFTGTAEGDRAGFMPESTDPVSKRLAGSHPAMAAQTPDTVTLSLMPNSVFENGGRASVHARIPRSKSSAITVTVSTSSSHVTQSGTTLTIPAGATQSFGTVVLTTVNNALSDGDRTVEVSGTATGVSNLDVKPGELEIVDDEGTAKLAFRLSSSSIYESANSIRGGVNKTSVIVESSRPASEPVIVNVSVAPYSNNAKASDFKVSGSMLTIQPGSTKSTGEVTITAVDNAVENSTKTISVSGTVHETGNLDPPASRQVSILNDDPPAFLQIRPHPDAISENGGVTKVTVTADAPVPEDISFTLAVTWGDTSLVTLGSNRTLRISKGKTTSTDSVTITAVDNNTLGYGKTLRLGRETSRLWGSFVSANFIYIYDDDWPRRLLVSAESHRLIESDGPTRIFATLSDAPTDSVEIEIGFSDLTTADSTAFEFSTNRVLVIPPGATTSTGEAVTLSPIDNDYVNPKFAYQVYLGATVTKGQSQVSQVTSVSNLTMGDDEPWPTVILKLSSNQISENGGTATVTAELDTPLKGETTTVTVTADPVLATTVAADFTQTGKTLTIAPGATTSTGSVTITAVDNTVDEPNKTVALSGSVAVTSTNTSFYAGRIRLPGSQHLRILEDDLRQPPTRDPTRPGAPTGLEATADGRHEIDLSWTPPSNSGGLAVTGYRIEVSTDAGETWSDLVADTGGAATAYTHAWLASSTTRHYRVRAINSMGESDPSNIASATTDPDSEPGPPIRLVAVAEGYHAIALSWTAPRDDGGIKITGYQIEVSADAGATWRPLEANTSATTKTYRHTGLAAGATRHYRVSAINFLGTGDPSNVASATTDAAVPPSAPVDLSGIPGTTQVSLAWSPPADIGGAEIERYEYRIDGQGDFSRVGLATHMTVTGLEPGRTYVFEVRAVNSAGPGAPASISNKLNAHPAFTRASYLFELAENVDGSESPVTLGGVFAVDPDGDVATYEMVATGPSLFSVEPSEGVVAYVGPGEDYESEPNRYEFAVRAYDGLGGLDSTSVAVIVTPVNEPPEAADDDAETPEDRPVKIDPLENDSDPEGDVLHVQSVSEAAHGTVEIVAETSVLYSPDENWHGEDQFTYVVSDGFLTDEATVSVTVLPVNDAPAAEGTIPDQMFDEGGGAVELDIAAYFSDVDGDSLSFAASSADPMVVAVAMSGSMLTMTPGTRGSTTIDVDATDTGGLWARQRFSVEVSDRMVKSVLTDVLGAMGRGYLASMRATLSRRYGATRETGASRLNVFGQTLPLGTGAGWTDRAAEALTGWIGSACPGMAGSGGGMPVAPGSIPGLDPGGAGPPGCSSETLVQPAGVGGSDLELVLAGGEPEQTGGGGSAWTLWTQGDIQRFGGDGSTAGGYDGELRNAYVGLDVRNGRWLAGLAYSRSVGTGDWDIGKAGGRVATTLNALHPYLRWSKGATLAWTMFGFGSGTAEHDRTQTAARETSGMGLTAGLIEVRHGFRASRTGPQVGLRGDAGWARLSTDPGDETIDGLEADVRQVRIGMELGWGIGTMTRGLTPFGQVHLRRDDGAGQNGRGVEVLGGVRARLGAVEVDARGRRLVVYSAEEYSESGASVALRIGGSPGQPGLSLQVEPRWGARAGPTSALWQDQLQPAAQSIGPEKSGIDASVGYGLPLNRDRVLFSFARFSGSEHGRRVQLGVKIGSIELVGDLNYGVPGFQGRRLVLAGRIGFGVGMPDAAQAGVVRKP